MLWVLCSHHSMRRNLELEATIVEKYVAVEAFLDERGRRIWAATSRAIGYGGDALVSDATGLSRPTIRSGRRELESGSVERGRIRRPGAGRPSIEQSQPGQALEKLVDPLTRGDPESPLRWTCKSRAKLTAVLSKAGWRVSSTTVSRCMSLATACNRCARVSKGQPTPTGTSSSSTSIQRRMIFCNVVSQWSRSTPRRKTGG